MASSVRDNRDKSRFELEVGTDVAFANYRLTPSAVIITHTETPRALRGRGIAAAGPRAAVALTRTAGPMGAAGCGFVVDYLRKHPEYADLVA